MAAQPPAPANAVLTPPFEVRLASTANQLPDSPGVRRVEHMVRTYEKLRIGIVIVTLLFVFTLLFVRYGTPKDPVVALRAG